MKILVADGIAAEGARMLEEDPGIEADIRSGVEPDELKNIIKNYDGIIIRSATALTADLIETGGSLKVIGRAGIGVDNVDVEAATRSGIVVMNTPEANAVTTAEHAIALMLALARKIPQAHISTASGKWERGKFKGVEIFGKTLGLVGLGTIGKLVAERAAGLKMNTVAYDPFLTPEAAERIGVKLAGFDETLSRADVLTIHAPLTRQTANLIGSDAIAKMKDGAILVNCARGGIVDEEAMRDAVAGGKLAGAALDVFSKEPPEPGSAALENADKMVFTPHLGASTQEAQEKVGAAIARQIIDFSNGVVKNAVNMPSLDAAVAEAMAPYIKLAEKMGSFLGQTCGGARKVEVEYGGGMADLKTRVLMLSVLKGLLSPVMDTVVTHVNAPVIASERGMEVVESTSTGSGEYKNLLTVSVETLEGGRRTVSGVIFGREKPRFISLDGVSLDVEPEGILLISENHDEPGIIAGMCGIISAAGVNIARMHLGRESVGGRAVVFTSVDSNVSEADMEKISSLKGIISITQVTL